MVRREPSLSTNMTEYSWFAGSAAVLWYNGATLANKDNIIVITFKYCYSFP